MNELTEFTTSQGPDWVDPQHDAAGNMTTIPAPLAPNYSLTLKYDAWNRLTEVTSGAQGTPQFEYDGLGRRIRRVVGSTEYDYYYNEDWQLLETRAGSSSNPVEQFVWHPYYVDALAVRYYDADTDGSADKHYYLQDANFNVTAVLDASAAVLERYQYSPYGEVTFLEADFDVASSQASTIGNQHLYTGRERDPETGLQLNRWRYYASHLGRWNSRDPIGYLDSFALYEFVQTRPVTQSDPFGLKTKPVACVSVWTSSFFGPGKCMVVCICPDDGRPYVELFPGMGGLSKKQNEDRCRRAAEKIEEEEVCGDDPPPDDPVKPIPPSGMGFNPNHGLEPCYPEYGIAAMYVGGCRCMFRFGQWVWECVNPPEAPPAAERCPPLRKAG